MFNETITTLNLLLIVLGFILLLFGGSGGYALFLSFYDKKKAAASKDWQSAQGKIISSQIKEVTYHDSDGTHRGLKLDAEYEYSVDGIPYLNNKQTPGRIPKGIPHHRAAEVTNRYAIGAIVPVHYNPQNPQESCLEREALLSNLAMIIGIVLWNIAAC